MLVWWREQWAHQQVAGVAGYGDADDGGGHSNFALQARLQRVDADHLGVGGGGQQEPAVRRQRQVVHLVPAPRALQAPVHRVLVLLPDLPSGHHTMADTSAECALMVCRHLPLAGSHSRKLASVPAQTTACR